MKLKMYLAVLDHKIILDKNDFRRKTHIYISENQRYIDLFNHYGVTFDDFLQPIKNQHFVFMDLKISYFNFDNYISKIILLADQLQQDRNLILKIKLIVYAEYLLNLYKKSFQRKL